MIGDMQLAKLRTCIAEGKADNFYSWAAWHRLKAEVMRLDNNECQHCKRAGRYRRGVLVHHVKHVTERPDLALSAFDENGDRQLITLCRRCHEAEHPEREQQLRKHIAKKPPLTEERWD